MKNVSLYPKFIILIGIIMGIAGLITVGTGIYINSFVTNQLVAQGVVTPEDASIPNTPVTNIPTALSMANIIGHHAAERGGGLTYAQMGRFAVESGDPAGTSNADEALKDANGAPVPNAARDLQLTAAGLVTSLSVSAMAIGLSYGAILLGVAFLLFGVVFVALGYMLFGLITPAVAEKYGINPVADSQISQPTPDDEPVVAEKFGMNPVAN